MKQAVSFCSTSCEEVQGITHVCGDSVIDAIEECDDGSSNSDTGLDACRLDCSFASCGDGVVDTGETCDGGDKSQDCVYGELSCTVCSFSCEEIGVQFMFVVMVLLILKKKFVMMELIIQIQK